MAGEGATHEAECSGDDVDEEEATGTVDFLNDGTELEEGHHVEADVDEAAVEKHGGDDAPPLMNLDLKVRRNAHTQANSRLAAQAPEDGEAARFAGLNDHHQSDREHEEIGDEEHGGDGGVAAGQFAQLLAEGGHGKVEVGAAFVAAGGVDADEGAARGADARAWLLRAATEKAAEFSFPALESCLPTIGKRQRSSLRGARSGTYNTGIAGIVFVGEIHRDAWIGARQVKKQIPHPAKNWRGFGMTVVVVNADNRRRGSQWINSRKSAAGSTKN